MENLTNDQNSLIDEALFSFQNSMLMAGQIAWQDIEEYLDIMEVDENGHLSIDSPFNAQVYTEISFMMQAGKDSTAYESGVEELANSLEPLRVMTDEYYKDQLGEINQQSGRMAKGLVTTMGGKTPGHGDIWDAFDEEAFLKDVANPAQIAMANHIQNGSTKGAMLTDMQHRIEDRYYNFGVTKSTTIMSQYIRRLNDIYGEGFELVWVSFDGAFDELNRHFCHDRIDAGRYYHKKEVAQWPANYSPWDGEIAGTDSGSIFVNLGGYNCRHALVYVEAANVPSDVKQRAANAGF